MKKIFLYLMLGLFMAGIVSCSKGKHEPLETGFSISYKNITPERLQHARSVGIDHIEVSGMNALFDANRQLVDEKDSVFEQFNTIKAAADAAGINIWSVQ